MGRSKGSVASRIGGEVSLVGKNELRASPLAQRRDAVLQQLIGNLAEDLPEEEPQLLSRRAHSTSREFQTLLNFVLLDSLGLEFNAQTGPLGNLGHAVDDFQGIHQ